MIKKYIPSNLQLLAAQVEEYYDSSKISYDEVATATNNFADENLLKRGISYDVYKGQLILQPDQGFIPIVARVSKNINVPMNEGLFYYSLNHKNIVSPFYKLYEGDYDDNADEDDDSGNDDDDDGSGNDDEDDDVLIIFLNKYEANGSLDKYLSAPTLTWMRRLHICFGVAQALKYLHHDVQLHNNAAYYIIHGNIKPSKILLDHNWEPKLHGFGFATFNFLHGVQGFSEYKGSPQYMDPAYVGTRYLTHKSDVFSFGVLLFEILFGREAYIQNNDNWYFARLARSSFEDRKLDDYINPDLQKQMNTDSLKIFSETAYSCLKEHRSQRPDMNQVLLKLEKALELQDKHVNPGKAYPIAVGGTSSPNQLKRKSFNHLKFGLEDIKLATNNFSETCCIGSGGYGHVYKAQLDVDVNSSTIEGKKGGKLPEKHNTVAIKRIFNRNDKQGEQGFFTEIEMLRNCKHPNIVSFHGFCDEGDELILIYEYVSNGSLAHYLGNNDSLTYFTLAQRIKICLDIAHGIKFLHTRTKDKERIIHRDIKSDNILLDNKWMAKIADFGLSKLLRANQESSTLITNNIAGTNFYLDPEYLSTGKLETKSDIYSFGVVLFEIICGKLAYDEIFGKEGLPSIARQCLNKGKLYNLVDARIMEDTENGGAYLDSLDAFINIAGQCLAETQSERPTIEVIIKELTRAFNINQTYKSNLYMSLETIKTSTKDFSNYIEEGRFWKLYEGEVAHVNKCTPVVVKRWNKTYPRRHKEFLRELEILFTFKHDNIVTLAGYCNEKDEKIIVYEHAFDGKLDKHLCDSSLKWMKRLQICIDVANGLAFLHNGNVVNKYIIAHRDFKSGSILLDGDRNAKICNFQSSCKPWIFEKVELVDNTDCNSLGYVDPQDQSIGLFTLASDVYSLGVILTELLCGRLAWFEGCVNHSQSLGPSVVEHYKENGNLDTMIFEGIKGQIEPQSLKTFQSIALQCLKCDCDDRPTASDVVIQLKKALEFQEDYEIWEPKLTIDYNEIITMSKYLEINDSTNTKKDLYNMLSTGILLQDSKVLFSLGSNGERNEMISARMFTYKNRTSHKWKSDQDSRFLKVAEMYDISKLKIQIKITTRLLSPDVNYGAFIIFKFCDTRKFSSKPLYVNLKYKMGGENLQAYFATWRDDKWMMIELCRFLTHKKETNFEVLLESFSRYYCGESLIRVKGIEFRVIDNVKNELQRTLESNSNKDQLQSLKEVNEKRDFILSAKEAVYKSSNAKHFHLKPSTESRFEEVIELLPRQVLCFKCKIQSQMMSQDTEYSCYIIFKLSEKCRGLHCPVKVRDLLHRNNKEVEIIYFRSPEPWNLHENMSVPKQREDGLMEIKVWKFNSKDQLKDGCVRVNLKLITYEGTMSGLIVCGLEFRA